MWRKDWHLYPTSSGYFERRLEKVKSEICLFGGGKVEVEGVYISGSFFGVVGAEVPSVSHASQTKEPI